jgi:hypothetical protein
MRGIECAGNLRYGSARSAGLHRAERIIFKASCGVLESTVAKRPGFTIATRLRLRFLLLSLRTDGWLAADVAITALIALYLNVFVLS